MSFSKCIYANILVCSLLIGITFFSVACTHNHQFTNTSLSIQNNQEDKIMQHNAKEFSNLSDVIPNLKEIPYNEIDGNRRIDRKYYASPLQGKLKILYRHDDAYFTVRLNIKNSSQFDWYVPTDQETYNQTFQLINRTTKEGIAFPDVPAGTPGMNVLNYRNAMFKRIKPNETAVISASLGLEEVYRLMDHNSEQWLNLSAVLVHRPEGLFGYPVLFRSDNMFLVKVIKHSDNSYALNFQESVNTNRYTAR